MIENLKKWMRLRKNDNRTYQSHPQTGGYTSFRHTYWQQPRDLPPFNFYTIYNMLIDPEVRMALKVRCAPLFGVEWAWKKADPTSPKGFRWEPGIQARRPEVALFIQRQLERIWNSHLHHIVPAQIWGWSAGEVTLKLGPSRLVEVNRLEPRHAEDCRLLLRDGSRFGVQVSRVKGKGNVSLQFPQAFFHSHDTEPGMHYGTSVLLGAFNPWADKWLEGGALDVRRLFMHKDAYGGANLGYPNGESTINGELVPNRDIARQIVEQIRAGNTITRPSERDSNGNEMWPLERATVPANPQHILQYPKDLDAEIRTGIGIPDGIIDSDNNAGLGDTKRVAMDAFYASLDTWCVEIIRDLTEQIFESLVLLNWGRAEGFQITHKPLAEQAMERQTNGSSNLNQGSFVGSAGGNGSLSSIATVSQPNSTQKNGPQEGERNADGLVFHNGRWRREANQPNSTQKNGPQEGERNADGLVFRNGRWRREDPLKLSLQAVGEGVLSAADMVKAAKDVVRLNLSNNREKKRLRLSSFNESDHPRAESGRFTNKRPKSPRKLKSTHSDIDSFIEDSLTGSGNNSFFDFAHVSDEIAELIKDSFGKDVSRYVHSITESDLRHILKRHGPGTETDDSVLPVTVDDIKRVPEIIASADFVVAQQDNSGRPGLKYEKIDNNRLIVIEVLASKAEKLRVQTMMKSKVSKKER